METTAAAADSTVAAYVISVEAVASIAVAVDVIAASAVGAAAIIQLQLLEAWLQSIGKICYVR